MSLKLYFDHNVSREIVNGLKLRNVDVISAIENGTHEKTDIELLDRASKMERVLFTMDFDFLIEAAKRQINGIYF